MGQGPLFPAAANTEGKYLAENSHNGHSFRYMANGKDSFLRKDHTVVHNTLIFSLEFVFVNTRMILNFLN